MSLKKNLISYSVVNIINASVPFFILPILTFYLSPEDFGKLSIIQLLFTITLPFLLVNIYGLFKIEYSKLSFEEFKIFVSSIILIPIFVFFIIQILFFIFSDRLSEMFDIPEKWIILSPIVVLFQCIPTMIPVLFQAKKQPFNYGLFKISLTILNMGLSLLFIILLVQGFEGRLYGIFYSYLIMTFFGIFFLFKLKLIGLNISFTYIKDALKFGIFLIPHSISGVVLSHARTVNVDGELIDIYTKYFIDELLASGKDIVEFESAHLGVHKKQKQSFSHYTDWIALAQRVYKQFIKVNIPSDKLEVLKKVEDEINTTCQSNIDLVAFAIKSIKTYKANYKIYNKIFQKVKPKTYYTVVSHGQAPIIKAAKDNGIEVVELQHGTFSKYHLGYSFPNRKKPLDYFPDKLYVWSEFWKKMIKLPIDDECVVVDGFRYLEKQKSKFDHIEKKQKQLVVLSQGAIGNQMASLLLVNIDKFKDLKIIYKLHPGEFDRYKKYEALQKLLDVCKNIEIVKETDLHKLLAESKYQIGINSTALFEGVDFGCETILFNTSGIEYMDKFVRFYKLIEYDRLFLSEKTKKDLSL